MTTPAHKGNTKIFSELTFDEQTKSITAMINNLNNAIQHHAQHASDPGGTRKKCMLQVNRLLGRLIERS
jgi:hypothetical protein